MMFEALRIIGFVLFSSVKFLFAPSAVYLSGFTFWETIAITITGGLIGFVVFFYTGSALFTYINERFAGMRSSNKKSFNRRNRLLIRVKSSWGIFGLAIFSPCLISIPIGSLLAAKYFRNDRRTIPLFIAAVTFWSFTLTVITAMIGPVFE